jgi:hypothetical protein
MYSKKQKWIITATVIVAILCVSNLIIFRMEFYGLNPKQIAILGTIPMFIAMTLVHNRDAFR